MEAASRGGAHAVPGGVWRVFVSCSEQPAKGALCPFHRQRHGGGCAPGGALRLLAGRGPLGQQSFHKGQTAGGWGCHGQWGQGPPRTRDGEGPASLGLCPQAGPQAARAPVPRSSESHLEGVLNPESRALPRSSDSIAWLSVAFGRWSVGPGGLHVIRPLLSPRALHRGLIWELALCSGRASLRQSRHDFQSVISSVSDIRQCDHRWFRTSQELMVKLQ